VRQKKNHSGGRRAAMEALFRCNRIGYIFQAFNLIQVMTAPEEVCQKRV